MIAGSALETPECLLGQIKITFAIKKKKKTITIKLRAYSS